MAGDKYSASRLNSTLFEIVELLLKNKIYNWFITYGTLLGIVRNNSCIDNDDDLDFLVDIKHRDELLHIFSKNNYKILINKYDSEVTFSNKVKPLNYNILKVQKNNDPSIDFYLSVENNYNYYDAWENKTWINSAPFIKKPWNDTLLFLPRYYESKLEIIYGNNWETPKKKGEYIGCTSKNISIIK
jgi:hypothetical protein